MYFMQCLKLANLNTSHVKVKRRLFQKKYLTVYYLNTSHVKVKPKGFTLIANNSDLFKYISC